ncbi:hypothetical protein [Nonomuraea sp. NPDC049480]|uniref:hypothetical protein n=1 Tax=Nonomuraea sp. NPDC049480 TaxID=3364353 RepID=UPI0037B5A731
MRPRLIARRRRSLWVPGRRAAHGGGQGRCSSDVARPQLTAPFTMGHGPRAWLAAGQALHRVLLTATAHGVAASMFS